MSEHRDHFTCPYCGDPYGLAPGPCAPCFLNGCKPKPGSPADLSRREAARRAALRPEET